MRLKKKYVVMAIGILDGVHRGHQAILTKARREARRLGAEAAVVTFENHPSRVLTPARPVPLLQTFAERCDAIRRCGVKKIFSLHFTKRLSKFSPSEFVDRVLFGHWNVRGVVVGGNFRFGRGRSGGVGELRNLLARCGASVWTVAPVRVRGRVVQSTAIRRFLQAGRLDQARRMLGRSIELTGWLEKGAGLGKSVGARTLNLRVRNELLPRFGVYAGWLTRAARRGKARPVVMNLGVAPTVQKGRGVRLEAHVLDGGRVSYRRSETLRVEIVKFLRPEQRFDSVESLRRAIQRDIRRARGIIERR